MNAKHNFGALLAVAALLVSTTLLVSLNALSGAAQETESVKAIRPPVTPLPSEEESQNTTHFSFIVYGDTRGGASDGEALQHEHSLVVDSMLKAITRLRITKYPVRFVLQSGDAVQEGAVARQWNISFVPLISRLTKEGNVPYFLVPGNHDVSDATTAEEERQGGLRNYFDAVSALIPPEGSPRRLSGYPTYAFGYGNTFVVALDADIAGDDKQFQWVKSQFEGLDRERYVNVVAFCHQAPFSSGPHGGPTVEIQTELLRTRYMPLFRAHHVRVVFSGHEHLFEHWVEHYTDTTGSHRMDLVVSGGGGAPIYTYSGEPDLSAYLRRNTASNVRLEHLVKPGVDPASNPHHFLIVRVDNDHLEMQVCGVDWGAGYQPYRSNNVQLEDGLQ